MPVPRGPNASSRDSPTTSRDLGMEYTVALPPLAMEPESPKTTMSSCLRREGSRHFNNSPISGPLIPNKLSTSVDTAYGRHFENRLRALAGVRQECMAEAPQAGHLLRRRIDGV